MKLHSVAALAIISFGIGFCLGKIHCADLHPTATGFQLGGDDAVRRNYTRPLPTGPHDNSLASPTVYGHIHMAKTGGTNLNGVMANKFRGVCGHKGYSYDAYSENERAKENGPRPGVVLPRGRLPYLVEPDVMNRIGYEDCDYISHEIPWTFWAKTFPLHGASLELHLPCRDPIEHLMSQCNHRKRPLNCNVTSNEELHHSIDRCMMFINRFARALEDKFDVKCYNFTEQFTTYMDYMSRFLLPRRFESKPYVKRETNAPRDKREECIWRNETLLETAKVYLEKKYDYYSFCNECIGGDDDLTKQ